MTVQGYLATLLDARPVEITNQPRLKSIISQADSTASLLAGANHRGKWEILHGLIERVHIAPGTLSISVDGSELAKRLVADLKQPGPSIINAFRLDLPFQMRRRGVEGRMVIPGVNTATGTPDPHLCRLIAQARRWFDQLSSGEVSSVRAISEREKVHETEISRVLPLAFLAPKIVELILDGGQPVELTATTLKRLKPFQGNWDAQHMWLGINS